MNSIGSLVELVDKQSGESTNGKWKKRKFVIETESKYPKKVCVQTRGNLIDRFTYNTGDKIKYSRDIESSEYQGRIYSYLRAWKLEATTAENSLYLNENQSPTADVFDRDMPF